MGWISIEQAIRRPEDRRSAQGFRESVRNQGQRRLACCARGTELSACRTRHRGRQAREIHGAVGIPGRLCRERRPLGVLDSQMQRGLSAMAGAFDDGLLGGLSAAVCVDCRSCRGSSPCPGQTVDAARPGHHCVGCCGGFSDASGAVVGGVSVRVRLSKRLRNDFRRFTLGAAASTMRHPVKARHAASHHSQIAAACR